MENTNPNSGDGGNTLGIVVVLVVVVLLALWLVSRGRTGTTNIYTSSSPGLGTSSQVQVNMPVTSGATQPQTSGGTGY